MIVFPNAKINVGLRVLRRRNDGYHDIETAMIPLPWCDVLEVVPSVEGRTSLTLVGESSLNGSDTSDNLVMKALRALERYIGRRLPPLDIYLSKVIPTGAGLGGGSADATFTLRAVDDLLGLGLDRDEIASVASTIGADCAFFAYNEPMLAEGIGERLTKIDLPWLDDISIVVAKSRSEAVSTREAYAGVTPREISGSAEERPLAEILKDRQGLSAPGLDNDFEPSIFRLRPDVARLKAVMQTTAPLYCSMSGSGSAVFALYEGDKMAENARQTVAAALPDAEIFMGRLSSKSLQ